MKIPKSLRLDGEDWKIELIHNTEHDLDVRHYGKTDDSKSLITLEANHHTDETFLHEIIHTIETNRFLEMTEQQVFSLSHGLYAVIRDNKLNFNE